MANTPTVSPTAWTHDPVELQVVDVGDGAQQEPLHQGVDGGGEPGQLGLEDGEDGDARAPPASTGRSHPGKRTRLGRGVDLGPAHPSRGQQQHQQDGGGADGAADGHGLVDRWGPRRDLVVDRRPGHPAARAGGPGLLDLTVEDLVVQGRVGRAHDRQSTAAGTDMAAPRAAPCQGPAPGAPGARRR